MSKPPMQEWITGGVVPVQDEQVVRALTQLPCVGRALSECLRMQGMPVMSDSQQIWKVLRENMVAAGMGDQLQTETIVAPTKS